MEWIGWKGTGMGMEWEIDLMEGNGNRWDGREWE